MTSPRCLSSRNDERARRAPNESSQRQRCRKAGLSAAHGGTRFPDFRDVSRVNQKEKAGSLSRASARLPAQRLTGHDNVFSAKNRSYVRRLGRSSGFRIQLLSAPSHGRSRAERPPSALPASCTQWFSQISSPVTAAGPQRIRTVFPILLPSHKLRETPRSLSSGDPQATFRRHHGITRRPDFNCDGDIT